MNYHEMVDESAASPATGLYPFWLRMYGIIAVIELGTPRDDAVARPDQHGTVRLTPEERDLVSGAPADFARAFHYGSRTLAGLAVRAYECAKNAHLSYSMMAILYAKFEEAGIAYRARKNMENLSIGFRSVQTATPALQSA